MHARPTVVVSAAVSLDGCLDDRSSRRLVLSGAEDLDEVDELRAQSDAVVVGAGTVRADDPRLVVRSPSRRAARVSAGLPPTPLRVVLTRSGDLGTDRALFVADERPPLLLVPANADVTAVRARLSGVADVYAVPPGGDPGAVVAELARRGAHRVLVEGGSHVIRAFLAAGAVDELRLAVAPVLVGDPAAPRLIAGDGPVWPAGRRARLLDARPVGDVAVMRYDLRGASS